MGLFAMEDQINEKFILPCVALAALTFRVICVVRWQPGDANNGPGVVALISL